MVSSKLKVFFILLLFSLLIAGCSPGFADDAQKHPWGGRPGGPEEWGRQPLQQEQPGEPVRAPGQPPNVQPRVEFAFPDFKGRPLPDSPEGELVKKQLGNLEISYFSTAIARDMTESGVDFFITLNNKGSTDVDVYVTPDKELAKSVPQWNLHFYSFQNYPLLVKAGETKKLWYYASVDRPGKFDVVFTLWLGSNPGNKVSLPVTFGSVVEELRKGRETSVVYGYVKDEEGNPVRNTKVNLVMNCGRLDFYGVTDGDGRYVANVPAVEDISAIYGEKEVACDSKDYFVMLLTGEYGYYFKEHVAPAREQFVSLNITLRKKSGANYLLKWEKKVDDNFGFFWARPSADFSLFAASQAKHPPELNKPTNFYLFDSQGNILWKHPTGNECWGIAMVQDGSKVLAGCHDAHVYAVDRSGKLLWDFDNNAMVRSVCVSKDGTKALSGGIGTLYLFNVQDGTKKEIPWIDEWFRNCQFFDDGSFVAGARTVAGFDSEGNRKWQYVIGEFPLFLAVDSSKNVYATGKSRTLFSLDANGNLRWKHRIPDHTATAGAATPDGSRIALGTVGGMVYLYDGDGNLIWKRGSIMPGQGEATVGHNAVAISDDGSRVVVGTAPGNCVILYDGNGTVLWQDCREPDRSKSELLVGVTNVAISKDKKEIVATYGDNSIREFVSG